MKEEKGQSKIIFEDFPGNKKDKLDLKRIFYKLKINKWIVYLIIVIFMFLISSILNVIYLNTSLNDKYKLVDKTKENYAAITEKQRKTLFYDIGFKSVNHGIKLLDSNYYEATEASSSRKIDGYNDKIVVYYDINNKVKVINFDLIFEDVKYAYKNINAVLKNFVNVNITKNIINEIVSEEKNYFDEYNNVYFNYEKLSGNYKLLRMEIKR